MRILTSILTLAVLFIAPGGVQSQEAAPDFEGELRAMVTTPTSLDQDRRVIGDFLDRSDVGAAAATYGVDLDRVASAVGTMEAASVADLARHVHDLEEDPDQVGGNTIVISSTAVIIALLILILINQ